MARGKRVGGRVKKLMGRWGCVVWLGLLSGLGAVAVRAQKAVVVEVSPQGSDDGDGTKARPFRTLERAQKAVQAANQNNDLRVELADGMYRIAKPLVLTAKDGGRTGRTVVWAAAEGAKPVISGAVQVTGWKIFDKQREIYVADTPMGLDSRQLWVNDRLVPVAAVEVPRSAVTFTRQGILVKDAAYQYIAKLADEGRMEAWSTGFFTKRISPVERASGDELVMRQPAWDNNTWGYDTFNTPYHPELSHLYFANSLAFLKEPGQWYLDPRAGKLYVRPPAGADAQHMDVELPRLATLLAVSGTLEEPVRGLEFRGIRFSHTSWLGPSSAEGYASQQSGSYLAGHAEAYPPDPLVSCTHGCVAFESVRNEWSQMPASIQVAAAERITFDGDVFAHLGQYGLGIGNDATASLTGAQLGTGFVRVSRCVFTDLAGGAILAGGVRRDAHHPHDPRLVNRQVIISNNRIRSVSKDYVDNSAILSTYVTGATIVHNDISDVPYDAIDIGYGWGMQDAGGNPNYRWNMRGYDWKQNLVYDSPTTHRDVMVAGNRIHGAKKMFHDGGAIYNLSASPGTLITENYIFDNQHMIALYLDEGSRYVTVRRNVVQDATSEWLNVNTVRHAMPLRVSPDNTAADNWHDSSITGGMWTNYQNDLILEDHLIKDGRWPAEAQEVMRQAGLEASAGVVEYGDATAGAGEDGALYGPPKPGDRSATH